MVTSALLSFTNCLNVNKTIDLDNKLINEFIKHLDNSQTTKATYYNCLMSFKKWLNGRELEEMAIIDYKNYLRVNYSVSTVNTHITAIKAFFRYLSKKGFINYASDIKGLKTSKTHKKDSLTLEQAQRIIKNLKTDTLTQKRNNALIRLLLGTGLRECETVNINISDIRNIGNKTVLQIKGKGHADKDDFVILSSGVINAINDYLACRNAKSNEPLFTSTSNSNKGERITTRSVRKIVKGILIENGIISDRITTHSLRHTFVTLNLLNGATLQEVQSMARHTSINTTLIYAHNIDKLKSDNEQKLDNLLNC